MYYLINTAPLPKPQITQLSKNNHYIQKNKNKNVSKLLKVCAKKKNFPVGWEKYNDSSGHNSWNSAENIKY